MARQGNGHAQGQRREEEQHAWRHRNGWLRQHEVVFVQHSRKPPVIRGLHHLESFLAVANTRTAIRKILIANRGEIALRVIRGCRELGINTVAVYSDADRAALHVLEADEAYRLGPAPATESYLRGDLILEVAQRAGAQAIHPGYGFLSENAGFAEACERAGVKFIGPSAAAMRALGSKTRARQAADAAGMPRTPGSVTGLASLEEAYAVASEIGYPVMLKAAAGGGGKGMRAVFSKEELGAAFTSAASEAERAFGSG